jgi:hypothetical protein
MALTTFAALTSLGCLAACGRDALPAVPPLPVTVVTVGDSAAGSETRYSGAIKAD